MPELFFVGEDVITKQLDGRGSREALTGLGLQPPDRPIEDLRLAGGQIDRVHGTPCAVVRCKLFDRT
jgi:hypothetical protein